jgi:hypothetical protein
MSRYSKMTWAEKHQARLNQSINEWKEETQLLLWNLIPCWSRPTISALMRYLPGYTYEWTVYVLDETEIEPRIDSFVESGYVDDFNSAPAMHGMVVHYEGKVWDWNQKVVLSL